VLLLVPHGLASDRSTIWAAAFGRATRPPAGRLDADGRSWTLPASGWRVVDVGDALPADARSAWIHTATLTGLEPGRFYTVRGEVDVLSARCRTATAPVRLPRDPDIPFTVWLGSCYAWYQDRTGLAGLNTANLASAHRPSVKILCGDQVYLDNPWYELLPRDPEGLATRFLNKYVATWTQGGGDTGFSRLLAEGPTYFLADDHEFWNNHPNWSPLLATRSATQRQEWAAAASALYRHFQTVPAQNPAEVRRLAVGPVEFLFADTRFGRREGADRFMTPAALAEVVDWLLSGPTDRPGVLVISAPLFADAANWFSAKFADRSLANYAQYAVLSDAIVRSQRAVLVLAGDIHCGRLAVAQRGTGLPVVEIISSPLALVDTSVGGEFHAAPPFFPMKAGGPPRLPVMTQAWTPPEGGLAENHFVTLGFTETDQSVRVQATAWAVAQRTPHHPIQRGAASLNLPRRAA
jgi:hypothetical protein